jgi:hypothetical protein
MIGDPTSEAREGATVVPGGFSDAKWITVNGIICQVSPKGLRILKDTAAAGRPQNQGAQPSRGVAKP